MHSTFMQIWAISDPHMLVTNNQTNNKKDRKGGENKCKKEVSDLGWETGERKIGALYIHSILVKDERDERSMWDEDVQRET